MASQARAESASAAWTRLSTRVHAYSCMAQFLRTEFHAPQLGWRLQGPVYSAGPQSRRSKVDPRQSPYPALPRLAALESRRAAKAHLAGPTGPSMLFSIIRPTSDISGSVWSIVAHQAGHAEHARAEQGDRDQPDETRHALMNPSRDGDGQGRRQSPRLRRARAKAW